MRRALNRLPGFLVLILTTLGGLAIGFVVILIVTAFERNGSWEQLDTPPGEIARLVTADSDKVVIEMDDKTIYQFFCRAEHPDEICWREVEAPEYTDVFPCRDENLPPPPSEVRDHIETCFEHEYTILTQYALLEDGSLWSWEAGIYPLGQAARLFWTIIFSVVLGAGAGFILLAGRKPMSSTK